MKRLHNAILSFLIHLICPRLTASKILSNPSSVSSILEAASAAVDKQPVINLVPAKVFLGGKTHTVADGNGLPCQTGRENVVDNNTWSVEEVLGCCASAESEEGDGKTCGGDLPPPVLLRRKRIGSMVQMTEDHALTSLAEASSAWDGGTGAWPQTPLAERIATVERLVEGLLERREDMANVLMMEIGKSRPTALDEVDRTIKFIREVIESIRNHSSNKSDGTITDFSENFDQVGSTYYFIRRAAIGIVLCLGPFNYPLNETYAALIPALLMGNVAIMKIPSVGGLVHLLSMEAFEEAGFPPGVMNFISGSGRKTMPPLMQTGEIDVLSFIGGSKAADELMKQHPEPHRLKVFLQLEAKNMGIFLADLWESDGEDAALERTVKEAVAGALSFNGQRCTAIKAIFVPRTHADDFVRRFVREVRKLESGLPWQTTEEGNYPTITPLPFPKRVEYMQSLISNAKLHGCKVVNEEGGVLVGGEDSTLMIPAILYPVTEKMDIFLSEQFGPVVPIIPYDNIDEIISYARDGKYAQQCAIFTSNGEGGIATMLLDKFSSIFGKITINSQCGRSPDVIPFSGRRSSAMGVMSISNSLAEFSVPTVVSYKAGTMSEDIAKTLRNESNFMRSLR